MTTRTGILTGFLIGYFITLIGMTGEDVIHGVSFFSSLGDVHHHIFPIIIGCVTSVLLWIVTGKEKIISEVREDFNQVTEQSPSVYEVYDVNGLQIEVNKAYEELWQFPEGRERTVRKFNVLKSEEVEKSGLMAYVKRGYAGETVTVPPYRYDPSGKTEADGAGRVRWLSTKIYPLKSHGEVTRIVITHEDITERMLAEEARKESENLLKISEERLVIAQQLGNAGSWAYDINTGRIWGSAEGARIYGLPPVAGDFPLEVIEACIPERVRVHQALMDLINEEQEYNLEFTINPADGSPPNVVSSTAILNKDEQGNPLEVLGFVQDITKRKQAEVKLAESEEWHRIIFEKAAEGIFVLDAQGMLIMLNEEFAHTHGYTVEEMMGMSPRDFDLDGDATDIANRMQRIFSGETLRFEVVHRHRDGHLLNYEVTANEILLAGSKHAIAFHRDISKRKRAEEQVLYHKNLLERAQELGHLGTWELDIINNRLVWTDENCRIFGVPPGSVVSYEVFLEKIHPDDREYVNEAWHAAMKGKPYDIVHRLVVAGETKWVREKADVVFDEEGAAVSALGFTQDITERKLLEESLRENEFFFKESQRAAHIGSYTSDFVNDTWITSEVLDQMFGMDDNYDKCVEGWARLLHPDDADEMMRYVMEDVIGKNQPFNKAYRIIRRNDGETRWVWGLGDTIVDDSENVVGLTGTIQDVTEQKQLEIRLNQAYKMEAVGTMAGGIAHDFNNLLSIIIGNIDIVQHKQNSGTSAEENLTHIKDATLRAKNLVAQILAFSRQEKPELISIDLFKAVTESLKLLRSTTPVTIEIMTTFADEPIAVKADTTQLQQVILNLSSNAAHAMDDKGLLTVAVGKEELASADIPKAGKLEPGPFAKISVSDTGTGMDKQILDRIFDPFFTTKEVGIGTGMGLSVIHGIVDQHGGFITVDSTVGAGSTFNVFLPVINAGVEKPQIDKEPSLPTGTERILFVDDEECIAYTCNELLECQGYMVTSVTSGIDALDLFKANPDAFDLVFTDQTMPVMTGAELATELQKIRPDIPIILCSGYGTKVSEEDAKGIGIREFCMKPMDMKQLAIVTRKVLDAR